MSAYAIKRESGLALYAQISQHLKQIILNQYSSGDRLPSEGDLAAQFGVNRHTLRRAVDELIEIGLLDRRHGLGIFVLDTQLDYQIKQNTRFTETLAAMGLSTESRILRKQTLSASSKVATQLKITEGDAVLWIESLRMVDQRPMCLISHFIPARAFPDLLDRFEGGSLHALLHDAYGCVIRRTESLVTAVLPQGDDAKMLGIPHNRPILRVKSINVDDKDSTPVEYAITRFRADRIQLCINP